MGLAVADDLGRTEAMCTTGNKNPPPGAIGGGLWSYGVAVGHAVQSPCIRLDLQQTYGAHFSRDWHPRFIGNSLYVISPSNSTVRSQSNASECHRG
jgi:hypothetical protein